MEVDTDKYLYDGKAAYDEHIDRPHVPQALNVIENPLQRYSKNELLRAVKEFCTRHDLTEHETVFAKGALVAQAPEDYSALDELDKEEKEALDHEKSHKWSGTVGLYYIVAMCALGATVQGWDQTGSNGANLSFPQEFGIAIPWNEPGGHRSEWILGIVNSIPYFSAALVGCFISDPLNKWLGRRGTIAVTAFILIATPIGSAFTRSWEQLLAVRLIMGLGIGAKGATVPVFVAELAPNRIRGALVMGWQLWVTFGIFLGFAANCVVMNVGRIAWRLQLASAFIPALPLLLGIFSCPESPRWLMKKDEYPEAYASYLKVRRHPVIATRDMYYSYVLYTEEVAMAKGASYFSRLRDCFVVPRIRRATLAAGTVMLAQQMCGVNIISFYSSTVFVEGGASQTDALYASLGFGAINFVFAIPAVFLIDKFGRRGLLLTTFPGMIVFLLAAGLAFLYPDNGSARTGMIAIFIYIFTAFYSIGEGPVCFLYGAEVFPTVHREQGMAFAVFINNFFASWLGLTFPPLRRALGPVGAFGFYAGLNLVAFIWIFCFVPETKQLSLEELDQVFSIPTRQFIAYESRVWLPYWIKRNILLQRRLAPPPPIYQAASKTRAHSV